MSHDFTLLPKECRIGSLDLCNEQEWQLIKTINTYHPILHISTFLGQDRTSLFISILQKIKPAIWTPWQYRQCDNSSYGGWWMVQSQF